VLAAGDTVWVTSRGKTWAFGVDLVPGLSRVAAPVSITFVRRPRPSGWALPSTEACGSSADRCAVISTRPLPPPQPHFDLSGFGLDTARYALLARLESNGDGVRIVGAHTSATVPYGTVQPLPALTQGRTVPDAGILLAVSREDQGRKSAVLLTVATLYLMVLGALVVLSGDARLWARRKEEASPHVTAAWALLNVFFIFLGIRLALGLRVAYSPPFYERAAATGVGLWVTFAVMLVALGRWSAWAPRFWRLVGRVERPISALFLPRMRGTGGGVADSTRARGAETSPSGSTGAAGRARATAPDPPVDAAARRRARLRTLGGLVLFLASLGVVLWQRPEAAAALVVAVVGLGAWLAMGVARSGSAPQSSRAPMDVVADEPGAGGASTSFAVAAGAAAVLVLAIHAPELALAPVLFLLTLFAVNQVAGWTAWAESRQRRGWILLGAALAMVAVAAYAFSPWPWCTLACLGVVAAGAAVWLAGRPRGGERRIALRYAELTDVGRGMFSGVGWIGGLLVLCLLVFLDTREIPPFVRFAMVFLLFLLAIRAGLACHRVLEGAAAGARRTKSRIEALGLLVIPLGVLLVFMLFDFGLGLVFFAPMFVTVLLAARIDRLPASLALASLALVAGVGVVAWSVLEPSVAELRAAPDIPSFSRAYEDVGNPLVDGLRAAGLDGPITRATVRSLAASDPDLLEEALAFAAPSEALLAAAPSREQVWGGRAYAASGWTGTGFAGTTLLGRGVPTAVSYAENTFSVYVLSEHGALGGLAVLATYLALLVVVGVWLFRVRTTVQDTPTGRAVLAMTVGGVLWLTIPAAYVAASNLGLVPLTGQNMPFLGLNSWADVVLASGLATGIVLALATLDTSAPTVRAP
jgi:cell division protein FtsW (lipid II flippase)